MTEATVAAVDVGELIGTVTGMLGNFSVANLGLFLAAGVGIAAGLVLLWFGFRFLVRKVMAALKKGKL